MGICDGPLPALLYEILELTIKFIGFVVFVGIVNYFILIAGAVTGIFFALVFLYCKKGVQQSRVIELMARGPINTFFSETVDTIITIRNFNLQKHFTSQA